MWKDSGVPAKVMVRNAECALFSGTCGAARVLESERQNGRVLHRCGESTGQQGGQRAKTVKPSWELSGDAPQPACGIRSSSGPWRHSHSENPPTRPPSGPALLRMPQAGREPDTGAYCPWSPVSGHCQHFLASPTDKIPLRSQNGRCHALQSPQIEDCSLQPTALFTLAARKMKPSFPPTCGRACSIWHSAA